MRPTPAINDWNNQKKTNENKKRVAPQHIGLPAFGNSTEMHEIFDLRIFWNPKFKSKNTHHVPN